MANPKSKGKASSGKKVTKATAKTKPKAKAKGAGSK